MSYTIQDFIPDFEHYLRFEKRYAANTCIAYVNDLLQLKDYLNEYYPNININEIKHTILRSWLISLKQQNLNETSIKRKISTLSSYFKFLIRNNIVVQNPCSLLPKRQTAQLLPLFLRESEATQMLALNKEEEDDFSTITNNLILEMFYTCGIRRGELINMKESDVEWSLKQIRILGKGNKERLIPIENILLEKIKNYIRLKNTFTESKCTYLFVLKTGKKMYDKYVYRIVKTYLSQVCTLKKKSPHILRHTFATHLLNNGAKIQAIKELLGHSSLSATQIYTHINIDNLKKIHKFSHPRA